MSRRHFFGRRPRFGIPLLPLSAPALSNKSITGGWHRSQILPVRQIFLLFAVQKWLWILRCGRLLCLPFSSCARSTAILRNSPTRTTYSSSNSARWPPIQIVDNFPHLPGHPAAPGTIQSSPRTAVHRDPSLCNSRKISMRFQMPVVVLISLAQVGNEAPGSSSTAISAIIVRSARHTRARSSAPSPSCAA